MLIIHLKRFSYSGNFSRDKLKDEIDFPIQGGNREGGRGGREGGGGKRREEEGGGKGTRERGRGKQDCHLTIFHPHIHVHTHKHTVTWT